MARKRSVNSYERTLKVLRDHRYMVYADNTFSLNGSGILGRATDKGVEIYRDILENQKYTIESILDQYGIANSLVDRVIS